MNNKLKYLILKATGAKGLYEVGVIQTLWSGYGKIIRFALKGADLKSVVIKHVRLPGEVKHPRGWSTDLSHERKMKSYQVEMTWY